MKTHTYYECELCFFTSPYIEIVEAHERAGYPTKPFEIGDLIRVRINRKESVKTPVLGLKLGSGIWSHSWLALIDRQIFVFEEECVGQVSLANILAPGVSRKNSDQENAEIQDRWEKEHSFHFRPAK